MVQPRSGEFPLDDGQKARGFVNPLLFNSRLHHEVFLSLSKAPSPKRPEN